MILRKLSSALKTHDWFTVIIEVIIVVLGILIALQVSNWATDRQNGQDERYYLNRLLNDIDQSISANEDVLEDLENRTKVSFWVADKLRHGTLPDNEESLFGERFAKIGAFKTGDFIDSTLLELQASGKFGVIQSKVYREQLGAFQLLVSSLRRGQNNLTDLQKAIELEIIPRVERSFGSGVPVLNTPFRELVSDKELQRYIERYASFYSIRLKYVSELQSALRVLQAQTREQIEGANNS
jgi:hypothetical protein